MENKPITFSVQMTAKEVYKFNLYHVYHNFSGLFGLGLSLLALLNLIINFHSLSPQARAIMTLVAAWFIVLEPNMMRGRAKTQVQRTKAYQQPLNYRIDETGITVSQNDESQTLAWSNLVKVVETKTQFLVYSSRIHSFVFPKSMMEGQENDFRAYTFFYTRDVNVQFKGKMKKLQKTMKRQEAEYKKSQQ